MLHGSNAAHALLSDMDVQSADRIGHAMNDGRSSRSSLLQVWQRDMSPRVCVVGARGRDEERAAGETERNPCTGFLQESVPRKLQQTSTNFNKLNKLQRVC